MPLIDLGEIPEKEVIRGYKGKAVHTGTETFMFWTVEKGAAMPLHKHIHQQVAQVIEGKFELTVADETHLLEPGKMVVIPPNVTHGGKAITECKLLDVFNPEREDYKF